MGPWGRARWLPEAVIFHRKENTENTLQVSLIEPRVMTLRLELLCLQDNALPEYWKAALLLMTSSTRQEQGIMKA